jgi:hypothetical protein
MRKFLSNKFAEKTNQFEQEGFLCPRCKQRLPSQLELVTHTSTCGQSEAPKTPERSVTNIELRKALITDTVELKDEEGAAYTGYIVFVETSSGNWTVTKRYNDFRNLWNGTQRDNKGLVFPSKTFTAMRLGEAEAIEERRAKLEAWMNGLIGKAKVSALNGPAVSGLALIHDFLEIDGHVAKSMLIERAEDEDALELVRKAQAQARALLANTAQETGEGGVEKDRAQEEGVVEGASNDVREVVLVGAERVQKEPSASAAPSKHEETFEGGSGLKTWLEHLQKANLGNMRGVRTSQLFELTAKQRAQLWYVCSGAQAKRNAHKPGYFEELRMKSASLPGDLVQTVSMDVPRAMPMCMAMPMKSTADGGGSHDSHALRGPPELQPQQAHALRCILLAYCAHNESIGYTAGMNIIGMCMYHAMDAGAEFSSDSSANGGDEGQGTPGTVTSMERAFWMLAAYVEDVAVPCDEPFVSYFDKDLSGLMLDLTVVEELLRAHLPGTCKRITTGLGLDLTILLTDMFLCFYANSLSQPVRVLVWDLMFVLGHGRALFACAFVFLLHLEDCFSRKAKHKASPAKTKKKGLSGWLGLGGAGEGEGGDDGTRDSFGSSESESDGEGDEYQHFDEHADAFAMAGGDGDDPMSAIYNVQAARHATLFWRKLSHTSPQRMVKAMVKYACLLSEMQICSLRNQCCAKMRRNGELDIPMNTSDDDAAQGATALSVGGGGASEDAAHEEEDAEKKDQADASPAPSTPTASGRNDADQAEVAAHAAAQAVARSKLNAIVDAGEMDASMCFPSLEDVRVNEVCAVKRSDGSWRYAQVKGTADAGVELQVDMEGATKASVMLQCVRRFGSGTAASTSSRTDGGGETLSSTAAAAHTLARANREVKDSPMIRIEGMDVMGGIDNGAEGSLLSGKSAEGEAKKPKGKWYPGSRLISAVAAVKGGKKGEAAVKGGKKGEAREARAGSSSSQSSTAMPHARLPLSDNGGTSGSKRQLTCPTCKLCVSSAEELVNHFREHVQQRPIETPRVLLARSGQVLTSAREQLARSRGVEQQGGQG